MPVAAVPGGRGRGRGRPAVHLFFSAPPRGARPPAGSPRSCAPGWTGSPPPTCWPCRTTSTSRSGSGRPVSPLRLRGMAAMLARIKSQVQAKPQVCVKNVPPVTVPRTGCDLSEAEVAGMGDTWGISGPAFLLFYVVLAVVVLIASIRAPTRRSRGRAAARARHRDPHPPARRRLPQRRRRAGAGLGAHRAAGCAGRSGRSAATRRPYRARTPGATSWSAPSTPPSATPIAPQVDREQPLGGRRARARPSGGWSTRACCSPTAQRRRIRGTGWWMLAVAGLGLLRLLAGIANARPVGWLVVAFIAVTIVAVDAAGLGAAAHAARRPHARGPARREPRARAARNAPTGRCTGRWAPRWGSASSGCRRCGRRTRRSRASSPCSG